MQFGLMITNNAKRHPASYWAETTAGMIAGMLVDEGTSGPDADKNRRDKRRFENTLVDGLEGHHQKVQDHETGALKAEGHERLGKSLDPDDHIPETVDEAMAEVVKASKVNPLFEAHFAKPEVQQIVRDVIRNHFGTAMDIERSNHADANAGHPKVRAWKNARTERGAAHAHVFMDPVHGVVDEQGHVVKAAPPPEPAN